MSGAWVCEGRGGGWRRHCVSTCPPTPGRAAGPDLKPVPCSSEAMGSLQGLASLVQVGNGEGTGAAGVCGKLPSTISPFNINTGAER